MLGIMIVAGFEMGFCLGSGLGRPLGLLVSRVEVEVGFALTSLQFGGCRRAVPAAAGQGARGPGRWQLQAGRQAYINVPAP